MTRLPNNYRGQQPRVIFVRERRRRQRRRFRWAIILIPLGILILIYILNGIEVDFSFDDVMSSLSVKYTERYRQLAVLGLIVIAIVAVAKVMAGKRKSEDEGDQL